MEFVLLSICGDAQNKFKTVEIQKFNKKWFSKNVTFHHPLPRREDLMLV